MLTLAQICGSIITGYRRVPLPTPPPGPQESLMLSIPLQLDSRPAANLWQLPIYSSSPQWCPFECYTYGTTQYETQHFSPSMPFGFIQIVVCIYSLFFIISEQYSIVRIYHSLIVHSPSKGHLGGSQLGNITNKTIRNTYIEGSCMNVHFCFSRVNTQEWNYSPKAFGGGNVMSEEIHKLSLRNFHFSCRNSSYIDVFIFVLICKNKICWRVQALSQITKKSHISLTIQEYLGKNANLITAEGNQ